MRGFATILICIFVYGCGGNATSSKEKKVPFSSKLEEIARVYSFSKADSIYEVLIGTEMDAYEFTDLNGKRISLGEIKKPIFLEATASWCKPCKALSPALNEIVGKYSEQIEFVLLTQDTKDKARKFAASLSPKITVVPSASKHDPNSTDKIDAGRFRQVFPFPTTYFISADKEILDIKTGAPVPADNTPEELERVKKYNTERLEASIALLLEGK